MEASTTSSKQITDFLATFSKEDLNSIGEVGFSDLEYNQQLHVLWKLSRSIPFKQTTKGKNRMRRYLNGVVIPRCKVPTILYNTLRNIREFRQRSGRAYCRYYGKESTIYVDFKAYAPNSEYNVQESSISHELIHSATQANDIRLLSEAYKRDGRTDRAYYHNGGFPNWDFGGKDVNPETYIHRTNNKSYYLVEISKLDEKLNKRINKYEKSGLYQGEKAKHCLDGRENPFHPSTEVKLPKSDKEAFKLMLTEANIAWYTTAKSFSEGYEKLARHSFISTEYSVTSPEEMIAALHELLQNPHCCSSYHESVEHVVYRHPWLLNRYLDCFEPHPVMKNMLSEVTEEIEQIEID